MKRSALTLSFLPLLGLVSFTNEAHAVKNVYMPAAGVGLVGVIKDAAGTPSVVLLTQDASGTCHRTNIFLNWGGLDDAVRVYGSSGADLIGVHTGAATPFCGYTFYGLTAWYGHTLDLWGGGGDDVISGGTNNTHVYGEGGNDVMVASDYGGAVVRGGSGHDRVNANGNSSAYLYGNEGDDRLCANGTNSQSSVRRLDGGSGWDNSCGVANPTSARVGVETADCSLVCTLW